PTPPSPLYPLSLHDALPIFTSSALKVLFALIGCRVRVIGKEYMETPGAKIYASNHTSYFDVLPLMLGLGVPYRFVSKMEVGSMRSEEHTSELQSRFDLVCRL